MSLSERLRPDVEAAPWVIEEVKALEAEIERLTEALKKELNCIEGELTSWFLAPQKRITVIRDLEWRRDFIQAALDRKEATNTKPEPPPSRLIKEWRYK